MRDEFARFGRNRLIWGSNLRNSLFLPCLIGKPNRWSQAKRRPIEMAPDMARKARTMMLTLRIIPRKPACYQRIASTPKVRD